MSNSSIAPIRTWLAGPLDQDVSEAIERLRHAPDVQQIAVMPDVHLSADVCIGVAVAALSLIYPQAVGGDIGCGMLAVGLDVEAEARRLCAAYPGAAFIQKPYTAQQLSRALDELVGASAQ